MSEGFKMKWEMPRHFPRLQKVCWCVPLRRGIIALVCLNLLLALLFHVIFFYMDHLKAVSRIFTSSQQERVSKIGRTKISLPFVIVVLLGGALGELVMSIVALVGLIRKDLKLIKAYLYFVVVFLLVMVLYRVVDTMLWMWRWEVPIFTVFLGFKIYYIITLRSQVKKMEMNVHAAQDAVQVELGDVPGDEPIVVGVLGDRSHEKEAEKPHLTGEEEYLVVNEYGNSD